MDHYGSDLQMVLNPIEIYWDPIMTMLLDLKNIPIDVRQSYGHLTPRLILVNRYRRICRCAPACRDLPCLLK